MERAAVAAAIDYCMFFMETVVVGFCDSLSVWWGAVSETFFCCPNVLVLHRRQQTLINGCKAFESAGLSPADSDSAQNDSISGCRSGSRNETAAMRNFGSPYGRY